MTNSWRSYKLHQNNRIKGNNIGILLFTNLLLDEIMHNGESKFCPEYFTKYITLLGIIPGWDK